MGQNNYILAELKLLKLWGIRRNYYVAYIVPLVYILIPIYSVTINYPQNNIGLTI